jgi:hypothetical protein
MLISKTLLVMLDSNSRWNKKLMLYDKLYSKVNLWEGNGVYTPYQIDRQDIIYYVLYGCNPMDDDYITRHNLTVDRLSEAIKLNCNVIGSVHENKTVLITRREDKTGQSYKTRI